MIYDISMTIHPKMTVYKDKPEKYPNIEQVNTFEKNGSYESKITMNLHTGTHIDFPLHMIESGNNSNTENLDVLIGKAKVFDLSDLEDRITLENIKTLKIEENDFIIFKTKNSLTEKFDYNFIFLALDAATFLIDKKIRGVGIDALGIERSQASHPTHKVLLSNNVIILEGLRLNNVSEGEYELFCLPLKIANVEALPVRAILVK